MPHSRNPFLEQMTEVMSGAMEMASGARREIDVLIKAQFEHYLAQLDVVSREEFEILKKRVEILESRMPEG